MRVLLRGWDTKDTGSCHGGDTLKVLIADDDPDQLDLMDYALRREGYTVLAAINGQQALQRYEAEHPDIVLLDVTIGMTRRRRLSC
jgi:PleD family two-component response regulator